MERKVSTMQFRSAILASMLFTGCMSFAQEPVSHPPKHFTAPKPTHDESAPEQDTGLLKKDLRSQKKQIVAANMQLSDTEAEKFWPIYDRYAADLAAVYDAKMALVGEYLNNYTTMNGDEAEGYLRRRAAVEEDIMQLRLKYLPAFRKVLSGRQTTLFFQIEWRLDLLTNLQLAQAPLIDP
jgi:hypothetical protein